MRYFRLGRGRLGEGRRRDGEEERGGEGEGGGEGESGGEGDRKSVV